MSFSYNKSTLTNDILLDVDVSNYTINIYIFTIKLIIKIYKLI